MIHEQEGCHREAKVAAAGWLNALDDAGIPAAVTEAIYVSDRAHVDYISTPAGARRAAHAVAQGILTWLGMR